MAKAIDFPANLAFHVDVKESKFVKSLQKILKLNSVPYFFKCCADLNDEDVLPVSFNSTTGALNYFNGEDYVTIEDSTPVASAINATATATATQISSKLITSTSAAATSITLPTATALATVLGAVQGTVFEFVLDNTAGASIVTVVPSASIAAGSAIITGSGTLTVAIGSTSLFRIIFTSPTTAKIFRAS